MLNKYRLMRPGRGLPLVGALLMATAACQDLDIDNLVSADRERATANPSDLETFMGGAFYPSLFQSLHVTNQIMAGFPLIASEFTATLQGNSLLWWEDFREPRTRHDNGALISVGNGPHGPRELWRLTQVAGSIALDGLQVLNATGMEIRNGSLDMTPRARAYAKFIQGWSWGYQALIFDQAHYIPETVAIPADPNGVLELARETLEDWPVLLDASLAALDEAIGIATADPQVVTFPSFDESALWLSSVDPVSNQQFIQMANTLAARILVLSARSPQDRVALDWNRVLQYTQNGLTSDFDVVLNSTRSSQLLLRAQNNTSAGNNNHRLDYRAIGLADQSGAYQAWINSPVSARTRFDIVTPDRRITGPTPTSDGAYVRYRANDNGFLVDRGLYLFSAYQWARHAIAQGLTGDGNTGNQQGSWALISVDENRLLQAEALLRLGDAAGAAELINVTRTREHTIGGVTYPGLPPVTAAGVPEVDGACVPRVESGECGSLLAALRYERMIELFATDAIRGYADSRGWGTLPDGTILSWPIPGNALQLYGMEGYTYGGVGEPNTATFAPVQ